MPCDRFAKRNGLRFLSALLPGLIFFPAHAETSASPIISTLAEIREHSPSTESAIQQYIVTSRFLRMQTKGDAGSYLLYDRKNRVIHNINLDDDTDLVIKPLKVELEPPAKFNNQANEVDVAALPDVAGFKVKSYVLTTNGQVCSRIAVADGLLPDMRQAIKEFRETLSGEQSDASAMTPPEYRSNCDLASSVFLPGREMEHGFPVRSMNWKNELNELVNFDRHYQADPSLFVIPQGLRTYTMREMREGAMGGGETMPEAAK